LEQDRQRLENCVPPDIINEKVVARTNGNMFDYEPKPIPFYGLFYVNNTLYKDGYKLSGSNDPNYYPCFCIRTDGSANIRWFTKSNLATELPEFNAIIASAHPLVFGGKSVLAAGSAVRDDDGVLIADWSKQINDYAIRINWGIGNPKGKTVRTLLGHINNTKQYALICTDSDMSLPIAAKLMLEIGCDFAVALDGSTPVKMIIEPGYANGNSTLYGTVTKGTWNVGYGSAICVCIN
jgi:hypothetical protein